MEHKAVMEKFPDMEHDDRTPSSRRGGPRDCLEFTNDGHVQIACLVPATTTPACTGDVTVAKK